MSCRASQLTVQTITGQTPPCGPVNTVNVMSSQSVNNSLFLGRLLHVAQSTLLMSCRASQLTVQTFPGQTPPCGPVNIVNDMSSQSVNNSLFLGRLLHAAQSTLLMSCRASQLTVQTPPCGPVNIVNVMSSQSVNNSLFLGRLLHVAQSTMLMSCRASQFIVLTSSGQTPPCGPVNTC